MTDLYLRPSRVCIEASSICQLRCPSCPTSQGMVADGIGQGFLAFDDFRRFIDAHPWVTEVGLSNWGEMFLNRDLVRILEHGHARGVALHASNGVNLNKATDAQLEALVRYRLRAMTCSIDGASPETYPVYRVAGHFDRVIDNLRRINAFKRQYRSRLPRLRWQFVAFGHNEHEIAAARAMAAELDMEFFLKLSWDDLYSERFSPVRDRSAVKREAGLDAADRDEYAARHGRIYMGEICHNLWTYPHIHHDGRLLGCSNNYWGDYGNVFRDGLSACLQGESMRHARRMLTGRAEAREDIPCTHCKIYQERKRLGAWVNPLALTARLGAHRFVSAFGNRIDSIRSLWEKRNDPS